MKSGKIKPRNRDQFGNPKSLKWNWELHSTLHTTFCEKHSRNTLDIIGCVEKGVAFRCIGDGFSETQFHIVIKPYEGM